jgi:uncharacterized membrane protein
MALAEMNHGAQERFAQSLGFFSIGLGLSEIAATRSLSNLIGISDDHPQLLRAMGMREIVNGVGILSDPREPRWVWSRVAGDVIDLTLLALAFASPRSRRGRLLAATAAVAGVSVLDVLCGRILSSSNGYRKVSRRWLSGGRGIRIQKSVSINRAAEELYRYCRDFSHLPRFIAGTESVTEIGNGQLRWRTRGPSGKPVESLFELVEDRANELISWRAAEPEVSPRGGSIRFIERPGGRGTIVRVEMLHRASRGRTDSWIDMMRDRPAFHLAEGLRRFKALMETGEIPTTQGQPSGRPEGSVSLGAKVGAPLGLRGLLPR